MKNIGNSLKRKIGPLPVWAWTILGFGLVWYYRNKLSAQSGTGTGSVAPTPATPQPGQVLEPGESYYDPNSGQLVTAPGGGNNTGNGTTTQTVPQVPPIGTMPSEVPPWLVNPSPNTPPAAKPPTRGHRRPRNVPRNAIWKGPHKPGPGWRGVGGGWWAPPKGGRRTNKGKGRHHGGTRNLKTKSHESSRSARRSRAGIRNHGGGRTRVNIPTWAKGTRWVSWGKTTQAVRTKNSWTAWSSWRNKGLGSRKRGKAQAHASQSRRMGHTAMAHSTVRAATIRQRPVANAAPHTATRHAANVQHRPSNPPRRTTSHKPTPTRHSPPRAGHRKR